MKTTQHCDKKQTIEIIKMRDGRYNYNNVPQENRMVFFSVIVKDTDRKAINFAKKINPNFNYVIVNENVTD